MKKTNKTRAEWSRLPQSKPPRSALADGHGGATGIIAMEDAKGVKYYKELIIAAEDLLTIVWEAINDERTQKVMQEIITDRKKRKLLSKEAWGFLDWRERK